MPNIKSAEKRVRTAAKSRAKNRAVMSKINTARRPVIEAKPADTPAAPAGFTAVQEELPWGTGGF